ncbi:MAG: 50S ribosomal protein L10 [Euryarchaeota archaeon]|nr:50S ribosomal protein L10 [Euryarchaeota archaeon]
MAHVAPWKKEEVSRLQTLVKEKPVVAIVGIGGIPSPQMLKMRAMLREHGVMRSGKNNLFQLALKEVEDRPGIGDLVQYIDGQAAILATDVNPFKLYKQLNATKQMMPAKGGDIAPHDIVIEKGETQHKPGPIVGELQKAGIPAAIEKGKVVIKKTFTAVKQGEEISADLAFGLSKLEIFPIEVGLRLQAVYEEGLVFKPTDLDIDEVAFGRDLVRAIQGAVAVGVNAPIMVPEIAPLIVAKAHREALALALEAGYTSPTTIKPLIGRATSQALAVATQLAPEALDEELQARLAARPAASAAPAAPAAEAKQEEEEEEEEEVSEEEAAGGLGALFG